MTDNLIALARVAKSRTPAGDIAEHLRDAARKLEALADIADMQYAKSNREMKEEASAFVAFISEVARPLDDLFRNVIRIAADNVGGFSPMEQHMLDEARIVSDAVGDNWTPYFILAALGSALEPDEYTKRYARVIELSERTQR